MSLEDGHVELTSPGHPLPPPRQLCCLHKYWPLSTTLLLATINHTVNSDRRLWSCSLVYKHCTHTGSFQIHYKYPPERWGGGISAAAPLQNLLNSRALYLGGHPSDPGLAPILVPRRAGEEFRTGTLLWSLAGQTDTQP